MDYKGSITIKAAPEKVLRALTEAKELVKWFPSTAKTDPKPGGKWEFTWEFDKSSEMGKISGGVFRNFGEFIEVSGDKVSYSWWAGKDFSASGSKEANYQTEVQFNLRKKGDSTEIKLIHTGFKTDREYKDHKEGWDSVLQSLKDYLEGRADKRGEWGQIVK
jgi:uncharacterized protein YndB with AHSA1/START domain